MKDIDKAFHYLRLDPISLNESNLKKKKQLFNLKNRILMFFGVRVFLQTTIDNVAF